MSVQACTLLCAGWENILGGCLLAPAIACYEVQSEIAKRVTPNAIMPVDDRRCGLNHPKRIARIAGHMAWAFLVMLMPPCQFFLFAMSCVFDSELTFRIEFEGLDLPTLRPMTPLLIAYIAFVELVTFKPLLVLSLLMASVGLQGLHLQYSGPATL